MGFLKQLKEVTISVLPIAIIAMVLGLVFDVFSTTIPLWQFLLSAGLVIIGLTFFLTGVNLGFVPVGNHLGSYVTGKQKLWLLMVVGLVLGLIITIAEPDVTVLASQVVDINPSIGKWTLIIVIALGVGMLMAFSYLRAITGFSLKWSMAIGVVLMLGVAAFVPEFFVSVAFDSGGATTGPMAVPFIMALGIGVSASRGRKDQDSFGYTGLASIGPVLFVLILGLVSSGTFSPVAAQGSTLSTVDIFFHALKEVSIALAPLVVICVLVEVLIMKLPKINALRIYSGIVYTWIGIVMFLFAVKSAFMPVASALGKSIAGISPILVYIISVVFGAAVVLAEPAIWLLTEQVEEVSRGRIKRMLMLAFICIGVALAVLFSMIRIANGLSIWTFLLPGYALVLLLLPFCPTLFVGIAFDSGGVATGPMSSTFLLPFAIGVASILSGDTATASFGMIGLIAMMPILAIEILGVVFNATMKRAEKKGLRNV